MAVASSAAARMLSMEKKYSYVYSVFSKPKTSYVFWMPRWLIVEFCHCVAFTTTGQYRCKVAVSFDHRHSSYTYCTNMLLTSVMT